MGRTDHQIWRIWHIWRVARLGLAFGLCLSALGGCAGMDAQALDGPCLDDSPVCVGQRTGMVQSMSADTQRHWIGETVGHGTIASGVRLFAYQNVRDKLSCAELASGISELEAAKQTLAAGPAAGQSMLRHNEIKAMTEDVRQVLTASRLRKCGAT